MPSETVSDDFYPSETPVPPTGDSRDTAPDPTIAGYAASDGPTTDDTLGFTPYVEAIASFLTAPNTQPPITISIEGEWGSGKSSFLLQLEQAIKDISPKDAPKPLTIRFNAWRHDKQDQLWAAFALAFVESLRRKIGLRRALIGDIRLFFARIDTLTARLTFGLVLLCYLLLAQAVIHWIALFWHLPHDAALTLLLHLNEEKQNPDLLKQLIDNGTIGLRVLLAVAGIYKLGSAFKLPLSLNLKKYLAKPDYEGHTAFVETFHKDLQHLVKSYAGGSRVYVFVDDLDRCDVPKAAELMQAINLMIGENKGLIFVLGMDREKVAAGVALKYKDLFPFLRETASWKSGEKDNFAPIAFGYGYLEKFIQLSFTLPIPNSERALDAFLAPTIAANVAKRTTPSIRAASLEPTVEPAYSDASYNLPPRSPIVSVPTVEYHRVTTLDDDDHTRAIIAMAAPLFEYNPRRIKQFTNTFRLALYIASDLGLFDLNPQLTAKALARPTPEQLGKVIALLLRFPDLRFTLEQNSKLLGGMQAEAIDLRFKRLKSPETQPSKFARWLEQPGAIDLLTFNLGFDNHPGHDNAAQLRYSLDNFQISGVFSILPRAPRPTKANAEPPVVAPANAPVEATATTGIDISRTGPPSPVQMAFTRLAANYESTRRSMPASNERTFEMTEIFNSAVSLASGADRNTISLVGDLLRSVGSDGERLMSLAVAYAEPQARNVAWLLEMLDDYRSRFEHYWCIRTVLKHKQFLDMKSQSDVVAILNRHWDDIGKDAGRVTEAIELRDLAYTVTPWADFLHDAEDPRIK